MPRSCCPDCDRWRCICLDLEGAEVLNADHPMSDRRYLAAELEQAARRTMAGERCYAPPEAFLAAAAYVRTAPAAPCPPYVREKLAALRDEFAKKGAKCAC